MNDAAQQRDGEERRDDEARLEQLRAALRAVPAPDDAVSASEAPPHQADPDHETAQPPVVDPLPEHASYRDTGCHVAPACLSCPLPACIFDRGPRARRRALQARNRRLRGLASQGWTTNRLAERFGLSPARVRRIRACARNRRPPGRA